MPSRKSSIAGAKRSISRAEEAQLLRRARRGALVQLKFGRAAHSLSMMAAILLGIAAIVVFLLTNWDYLEANAPWLESTKWFIPLSVGVIMSVAVIYLKWEPFLTDRGSWHFIVSFIALGVPSGMIVLLTFDELGYIDVGTGRWIYPVSFVGVSLSLVSMAMIWEGMSRRKTVSTVSALVPLAIMFTPALFGEEIILGILPMVYLGSAVCLQLSGSMLHVISTSTSVQEREILRAGDAKITSLRDEIEMKEEEIDFKEKSLREREIEVETYEKSLNDQKMDLEHRRRQAEKVELSLRAREEKLQEERNSLTAAKLDIRMREERLEQRELETEAKESEHKALVDALQQKERRLTERLAKLQKEQSESRSLAKQLKDKEALLEQQAQTFKNGRDALLAEQMQLAEKLKELQLKESSLDMRIRSAESMRIPSGPEREQMEKLKRWEEGLLSKETRIANAETEISKKELQAQELMKQAELKLMRAESQLAAVEKRETELLDRETTVATLEKEVADAKIRLQEKSSEIELSKKSTVARKEKYEYLVERLSRREAELSEKDEMIEKRMAALDSREANVKELQERLRNELKEIETKRRELIELDKRMSSRSSQLQVRELEIRGRQRELENMLESGIASPSITSGLMDELRGRERALDMREKMLAEKERELRRAAYERERPEAEEMEGEEAAPAETAVSDKISTGTQRLDDLLYGGIPYGSSVLFTGPPFSGKEVGILNFLAGGMKRGVPAVIITTSKSPSDLAKDFAPILPTFLEMERLGLVRWIDATSTDESKRSGRTRKSCVTVDGPDDFPGILEALEKLTEDVRKGEHQHFTLGYLSLSTSISHTDEVESTRFIQAIVRTVRDLGSGAMFALEKGMHSEQQTEAIQHLMDGAFVIKIDKQKTFLSVIGIGEVQTRDWIEYRHTNKGLIVGAFSLERIR